MRLYKDDLKALQDILEFLSDFNEPEGFYINISITDEGGVGSVGKFEYDGTWAFQTEDVAFTR